MIHAARRIFEDAIREHSREQSLGLRRSIAALDPDECKDASADGAHGPVFDLYGRTADSLYQCYQSRTPILESLPIVPGGNCAPKSLISRPDFLGAPGQKLSMASRISLTVLLLVAPLAALAQAPVVGDATRGQALAYTCSGCHAIPNYKNVYPTYSVPKLHGQRAQYLAAALKEYKSGDRSHGTMHSQAASMSEQDMADVATYLAGPNVLTNSKTDVKPSDRPKASEVCLACHGTNGVGITADYPTISGQHSDYIERALTDYQKGARKNAVMAPMVATLTKQDIEELAAYYSSQTPALSVVPKKVFFFSGSPAK